MIPPLPEFLRDGIQFSCTDCGACCSGAPGRIQVSEFEISAIADVLGEEVSQLRGRAVRQDDWGWTLRERENGDCLFFENGRCSIHAVKPRQCALYPFWFQNVRNEEAWKRTCAECPGIGQGPLISSEAIVRQVASDLERLDEREGL